MFAGNLNFAGLSPEERVQKALRGFSAKTVTVDTRGPSGPAITQALTVVPDNAPMKRTVGTTLMAPQVGTTFANTPVQFVPPKGTPFGWQISDVWNFKPSRVSAASPRGFSPGQPQVKRFAPSALNGVGQLGALARLQQALGRLNALADFDFDLGGVRGGVQQLKTFLDSKQMLIDPNIAFLNTWGVEASQIREKNVPLRRDYDLAVSTLKGIVNSATDIAKVYRPKLQDIVVSASALTHDQKMQLETVMRDFEFQTARILAPQDVLMRTAAFPMGWVPVRFDYTKLYDTAPGAPMTPEERARRAFADNAAIQDSDITRREDTRPGVNPDPALQPEPPPASTATNELPPAPGPLGPVREDDSTGSRGSGSKSSGGTMTKSEMQPQPSAALATTSSIPWWVFALGAGAVGFTVWKLRK